MALITRISRLFKADFHAVLDQIEEPGQLLKQAIRDMEDELATTEQRITLCAHDQEVLSVRRGELEGSLGEIDERGVAEAIEGVRRGTPGDLWKMAGVSDNTLVIGTR